MAASWAALGATPGGAGGRTGWPTPSNRAPTSYAPWKGTETDVADQTPNTLRPADRATPPKRNAPTPTPCTALPPKAQRFSRSHKQQALPKGCTLLSTLKHAITQASHATNKTGQTNIYLIPEKKATSSDRIHNS